MGEYKVLIGSRSPELFKRLAAAFAENPLFDVGVYVPPAEVIDYAVRFHPDVVLWKVENEDPLGFLAELKRRCPLALPVFLVQNPQKLDLRSLVDAGLRGCLPLRLPPRQLVQAVELIVKSGILCLPRPDPEKPHDPGGGSEPALPYSLTEREIEILALIRQKCPNQEIGRRLFMSESTVKTHLRTIFRKLGVRNRTQAVITAIRRNLLRADD